MDIEEGELVFDTEQPLQTVPKGIGGHHDRERSQGISRLERLDLLNQGVFKVGMERAGDNAQHRESLRFDRESQHHPVHV